MLAAHLTSRASPQARSPTGSRQTRASCWRRPTLTAMLTFRGPRRARADSSKARTTSKSTTTIRTSSSGSTIACFPAASDGCAILCWMGTRFDATATGLRAVVAVTTTRRRRRRVPPARPARPAAAMTVPPDSTNRRPGRGPALRAELGGTKRQGGKAAAPLAQQVATTAQVRYGPRVLYMMPFTTSHSL